MNTMRLQAIHQPERVERLLEAYVQAADLLPPDAYRIRDRGALPTAVQALIAQAIRRRELWCCYTDGTAVQLFVGEMSLSRSLERRSPVLEIRRYTERGDLAASGAWITDQDGHWRPCTD